MTTKCVVFELPTGVGVLYPNPANRAPGESVTGAPVNRRQTGTLVMAEAGKIAIAILVLGLVIYNSLTVVNLNRASRRRVDAIVARISHNYDNIDSLKRQITKLDSLMRAEHMGAEHADRPH